MMPRHTHFVMFAVTLFTAAACSTSDAPAAGDAARDSAAPSEVAPAPAMAPAPATASAPSPMQEQLAALLRATPAEQVTMLPAHRQQAANLLAEMNGEMRGMNMTGDAAWTATVDSIRQDLVQLPDLKGQALSDALPPHAGRIERLIAMHRKMMSEMKM